MITVTEEARLILRGILDAALKEFPELPDGMPGPGLRLLIEEDGASFALDYPEERDEVISDEGKALLIVAQDITEVLGDSTINIIRSPDGDQLSIQREVPKNGHAKEAA